MTPRHTVLVPQRDLAGLFAGGPLLLADSLLPEPAALAIEGLALVRVEASSSRSILRLSPPAPAETLVAIAHPPAGVLALLGPEAAALQPLLGWWQAAGAEPPTLILAEGALDALPVLLGLALADGAGAARRTAALELALAELRTEAEALRESAAAMAAALPAAPALAPEARLLLPPEPGAAPLRLVADAPPLDLAPGLPTEGVAAVALHVAAPATALLHARLSAAESGRVLAEWRVPPAAATGGWLRLDLAAPDAGRAETLALLLSAEGPGEVLLSAAAAGAALAIGTARPGFRPMPAAFLVTPTMAAQAAIRPLQAAPPARTDTAAAANPAPRMAPAPPAAAAAAHPQQPIAPAATPAAARPRQIAAPTLAALPLPAALPDAPPGLILAPPPPAPPAPPSVMLDGRQQGEGWALIDIRVANLSLGADRWDELKLKFGIAGEDVTLEFRRAPGWPRAFEAWPGEETDAFGDKFVIVLGQERLHGLDRIAPGRDRALVTALAEAMPALVAEALAGDDPGRFAEAAARLRARLGPED
jgi:hypothetical protein